MSTKTIGVGVTESADAPDLRYRVLFVDDEEENVMDASKQLIELKGWCLPLFARPQAQALEYLEERHIDAAIIDIELDGAGRGDDVLRSIGERAPDAPVLGVTKYTDPVSLQALLQFVGTAHPRVVGVKIKQQ